MTLLPIRHSSLSLQSKRPKPWLHRCKLVWRQRKKRLAKKTRGLQERKQKHPPKSRQAKVQKHLSNVPLQKLRPQKQRWVETQKDLATKSWQLAKCLVNGRPRTRWRRPENYFSKKFHRNCRTSTGQGAQHVGDALSVLSAVGRKEGISKSNAACEALRSFAAVEKGHETVESSRSKRLQTKRGLPHEKWSGFFWIMADLYTQ